MNPAIDSYSAFRENDHRTETGLAGYLRERGVTRVVLVGLALDYCVGFSAIDARACGFEAIVVEEACRAIDSDGSLAAAPRHLPRYRRPGGAQPRRLGPDEKGPARGPGREILSERPPYWAVTGEPIRLGFWFSAIWPCVSRP